MTNITAGGHASLCSTLVIKTIYGDSKDIDVIKMQVSYSDEQYGIGTKKYDIVYFRSNSVSVHSN